MRLEISGSPLPPPQKVGIFDSSSRNEVRLSPNASQVTIYLLLEASVQQLLHPRVYKKSHDTWVAEVGRLFLILVCRRLPHHYPLTIFTPSLLISKVQFTANVYYTHLSFYCAHSDES